MALFGVMRKKFIDLPLDPDRLTALADMLWLWWCQQSAGESERNAVWAEAIVFCIPRSDITPLQSRIQATSPKPLQFDLADPDELKIIGPVDTGQSAPDISAWLAMLSACPDGACARLRISFEGLVKGYNGRIGSGRETFVLVGEKKGESFNLMSVWRFGRDEALEATYRLTPWPSEGKFVEALELYIAHRNKSVREAVEFSWRIMGIDAKRLFKTDSDQKAVLRATRAKFELPDDRHPLAFARRVGTPLLIVIVAVVAAVWFRNYAESAMLFLVVAAIVAYRPITRLRHKFSRILAYRKTMCASYKKLYSGPIDLREVDLSTQPIPMMEKLTSDLQELGARRAFDVAFTTSASVFDANRIFILGDTSIVALLVRNHENLQFFPPRPSLVASTRFRSGGRHATMNRPYYRRSGVPRYTLRCLNPDANARELLEAHQRSVKNRSDAGEQIIPPPLTVSAHAETVKANHELNKAAWKRSPYSWSDAIREVFDVCRREFLQD